MLRAEQFRGYKIASAPYPILGARTSGIQKVVFDLVRSAVKDTLDTVLVRLQGNVVVAGAGGGTKTGAYNPEGLLVQADLQSTPAVQQLKPINAISGRYLTIDHAIRNRGFELANDIGNAGAGAVATSGSKSLTDAASTQALDVWFYLQFKLDDARKGIEFALPMNRWSAMTLTLQLGTIDQLFSGSASTYDMSGVTVELWGDMDVNCNPQNIHATELFEIPFNITASNKAFDINNLPQGVVYDELVFISEDAGKLTDGIIQNIALNSGGRNWTLQDIDNATFIKNQWTRPLFTDKINAGVLSGTFDNTWQGLQGILVVPLRDGMWSKGMDAGSTTLDIKLSVTSLSASSLVRVCGRKLIPFGIRATHYDSATKMSKVIENVPIIA